MRRRQLPGEPPPPTKGELKRGAQEIQTLGERLIDAPEGLMEALDLPEKLVDAILLARKITAHGGRARQRQFVGKLMRKIDTTPVFAALEAAEASARLDALRFQRAENWRNRLVDGGASAMADFLSACPGLERQALNGLLGEAIAEKNTGHPAGAGRRLYRLVRLSLDQTESNTAESSS